MTGAEEFTRFATAMSTMPDLIETILRVHAVEGTCRACRVAPGRPPISAPCGPRAVALLAAEIARDATEATTEPIAVQS